MISYISGQIIQKTPSSLIIKTNNLGFEVYTGQNLIASLPPINSQVELYTYLHFRENIIQLYGFPTITQLETFKILLSVSGIGPKVALSILDAKPVAELKKALEKEDLSFFTAITGIGQKTAQRILLELKNKLISLPKSSFSKNQEEAIAALESLGFTRPNIIKALAESNSQSPTETIVRETLKKVS